MRECIESSRRKDVGAGAECEWEAKGLNDQHQHLTFI